MGLFDWWQNWIHRNDPPAPTPDPGPNDTIAALLVAHNEQRAQNGVGPMQLDSRLNEAAQKHSNYQAALHWMTHLGEGGFAARIARTGFSSGPIGENVAWESNPSVSSVMTMWMDSPGHRRNILDPNFVAVGFGVAKDSRGTYWTADFGGGGSALFYVRTGDNI